MLESGDFTQRQPLHGPSLGGCQLLLWWPTRIRGHIDLADPFRLAKIQRRVKTPELESGQRKKEFFSFGEVQILVAVSV